MRFLLFLLILQSPFVFAASVAVIVDRNPTYLNESFDITFSAAEEPDAAPDFSPLEKDFEILNENRSSSISWVNGERTSKIQWVITLMAKKTGKQVIPALKFGADRSLALSILVSKNRAVVEESEEMNAPLFLEVEVTPKNPYIQSQVIYTLSFFRRVNIADASLKELELNNAVVEKLGEDKTYKVQRNAMDYVVTERKYAIFPQKSGEMIIESLELTAAVMVNSRSRSFFGTQRTKTERIKSKAITLNVRPIPIGFTGEYWLAARDVKLVQQWSGDELKMQVGEPLTRTLTLMIEGATVGQLPDLQQSNIEKGLKSYPDKPTLKEKKTDMGIIALREEKVAFIPSKAGTYTLPEISLEWFNVETEEMETTKIPETVVTAVGGVVKPPVDVNIGQSEKKVSVGEATTNDALTQADNNENTGLWQGLSAFFAAVWLLTLFLYFNKKSTLPKDGSLQSEVNLKESVKVLKKVCDTHDAHEVKRALLVWGKLKHNCSSLGLLAKYCDEPLQNEILRLNKSLYGQQVSEWNGSALLQAFLKDKTKDNVNKESVDNTLEPLYKI